MCWAHASNCVLPCRRRVDASPRSAANRKLNGQSMRSTPFAFSRLWACSVIYPRGIFFLIYRCIHIRNLQVLNLHVFTSGLKGFSIEVPNQPIALRDRKVISDTTESTVFERIELSMMPRTQRSPMVPWQMQTRRGQVRELH